MNKVPAMHLFISLSRWDSQTQAPLGSEREKVGQLGETRSGSAQSFFFVTFAACGPLGPVTISNSTKSPSDKLRYPSSKIAERSEEHTSELQSRGHLVCRLLLEKKNELSFYALL